MTESSSARTLEAHGLPDNTSGSPKRLWIQRRLTAFEKAFSSAGPRAIRSLESITLGQTKNLEVAVQICFAAQPNRWLGYSIAVVQRWTGWLGCPAVRDIFKRLLQANSDSASCTRSSRSEINSLRLDTTNEVSPTVEFRIARGLVIRVGGNRRKHSFKLHSFAHPRHFR